MKPARFFISAAAGSPSSPPLLSVPLAPIQALRRPGAALHPPRRRTSARFARRRTPQRPLRRMPPVRSTTRETSTSNVNTCGAWWTLVCRKWPTRSRTWSPATRRMAWLAVAGYMTANRGHGPSHHRPRDGRQVVVGRCIRAANRGPGACLVRYAWGQDAIGCGRSNYSGRLRLTELAGKPGFAATYSAAVQADTRLAGTLATQPARPVVAGHVRTDDQCGRRHARFPAGCGCALCTVG